MSSSLILSIQNTFLGIIGASFFTIIFSFLNTRFLVKYKIPFSELLDVLSLLIFVFPTYILAGIYNDLFKQAPMMESLWGYSFVLGLSFYPLCFIIFRNLHHADLLTLEPIAKTLSLSVFTRIIRLSLPYYSPPLFIAVLLIGSAVLGDFASPKTLGIQNLCTYLFNTWFSSYDSVTLYLSLSYCFSFFIFAGFFTLLFLKKKKLFSVKSHYFFNKISLRPWPLFFVYTSLFLPILFGFIIPFFYVLFWTIQYIERIDLSNYYQITLNTFFVALIICFFCIFLTFIHLIWLRSSVKKQISNFITVVFGFFHLMPSLILAYFLFLLIPILKHLFSDHSFQIVSSLNLPIFIILAHILKFGGPCFVIVLLRHLQISKNYDQAALSLGMTFSKRIQKVFIPLFGPSLLLAGLYVFIESVKELPLTLVLRPFLYESLSIQIYSLMTSHLLQTSSLWILTSIMSTSYFIYLFFKYFHSMTNKEKG